MSTVIMLQKCVAGDYRNVRLLTAKTSSYIWQLIHGTKKQSETKCFLWQKI